MDHGLHLSTQIIGASFEKYVRILSSLELFILKF
jgi:hypothetical protein